MKRRVSITTWPALRNQQNARAATSHPLSASLATEAVDAVGLCEAWRGWEAGTRSEFLNWFLFSPHGRSSTPEPAVLEDWICFQNGSAELNERTRASLDDRMELLRGDPGLRIVIGGLASRAGTIAHDMRLGLRRVISIRTFLLAAGADPDRIGIALRGSGWSVTERSAGPQDSASGGGEWRIQVTDPLWTLARN